MAENSGDLSLGYMMGQSENRGGGFGGMFGEGLWAIIILAMLGFGGGYGFGGGFGGAGLQGIATRADINEGFALQNITGGIHGLERGLCDGFYNISSQLAQCCCDIERGIERNTTQGVMNTNTIQQQISACCCDLEKMDMARRYEAAQANCGTLQAIDKLGDRILGYLANKETQDLRDEVQAYRLQASQAKQNQYLLDQLRPCPVPAYITCNPYAASYGFGGNGCGCGCG